MEGVVHLETGFASPSQPLLRVAVAIAGSRNSAFGIKWTLENFISEGKVLVNLLHVREPITEVPTTLGIYPVSQVAEDVVAAYKMVVEREIMTMLLPFKQMCTQRKVQVYVTMIEGAGIADAILKEISNSRITKLVIGSSSPSIITRCFRRFKSKSISSRIVECAPSFCAVYVVSKGKLSTSRPLGVSANDAVHLDRSCSSSSTASSIRQSGQGFGSPPSGFSPRRVRTQRFHAISNLSTPATSANNSNRPSLDVKTLGDIIGSKSSDSTENGSKITDERSNLEDNGSGIFNNVIPSELAKYSAKRTSDKRSTLQTSRSIGIRISDSGSSIEAETDSSGSSSSDEEFNFQVATENTGSSLSGKHLIFEAARDTGTRLLSRESSFKGSDLVNITARGPILEASAKNGTEMYHKSSPLQVAVDNGSREFDKVSALIENGSRVHNNGFTFDATVNTTGTRLCEENGSKVSHNGLTVGAALGTTRPMLPAIESISEDKFTTEAAIDNGSMISDQSTELEAPSSLTTSASEVDIVFDLKELGIDWSQLSKIYAIPPKKAIDVSSEKQTDACKQRKGQTDSPKKVLFNGDNTRDLQRQEKEKCEVVKQKDNEYKRECVKTEANLDDKEKESLDKASTSLHSDELYNMFTWEDIVLATSSFSSDLLIGEGAFGSVYKCKLHHTTTAVKILHSKESHWTKQFHQEVEVLSKVRHPHLVLLLGSCPDHGCLVYEYMEKGSLDDRLLRKDNTPPIPWFERYRIAWEVASALVFLHNAKPKPIVHRDLKPANILLDHNYVSKIGDVGLSTKLPSDNATIFKETSPVGTLCYIDPEYQRTGMISPKSDVYAFGMVILQLLTAKPAIALTRVAEKALENGRLRDILDPEAGNWPVEETQELAVLGLSCTELRHRDRPDLKAQILPVLEKLLAVAERARDSSAYGPSSPCVPSSPPQHFICPILQDVMDEPCVAADGYTYDRKAIELWLKDNENSPMTNLPLPSKNLLPNFTLHSAIMDWKSRKE